MLALPDNELDELADNFFCHLHDHSGEHDEHGENGCSHSTSKECNLLESLNPLRDISKLRKSILASPTLFVMNENHLRLDVLKLNNENLNISCGNCAYNIGYKGRQ